VRSVDIVEWVQLEEFITLATGTIVVEVLEHVQVTWQLHAGLRELGRHSESRM
jgi:hypothetical protein